MSGHSKWAQIKRQKGANDVKKGLAFTKLGSAISLAVRAGGGVGDPNQNFHLRLAIDAARAQNMPKENIERAIERAMGKQGVVMEEVLYEGFGPQGVAIMVEAATDNKNRTTSEVANVFNKNGGNMGQMGSVAYMFTHMGRIIVDKKTHTFDDVFLSAAEAGAEDAEDIDTEVFVYTQPGSVGKVRDTLQKSGYSLKEVELLWKPGMLIEVPEGEKAEKIISLIEKLEELDDVLKVYSNFDIQES